MSWVLPYKCAKNEEYSKGKMAHQLEDMDIVKLIAPDLKCVYFYYGQFDVCGLECHIRSTDLGLACLCGNAGHIPSDVVVKLSTQRSELTDIPDNQVFYVQKGTGKTKFIFHIYILHDQSDKDIMQSIVKCLIECNTRECEDIVFDVDRSGIDPTRLGEIFKNAVMLYISCENKKKFGKEIRLLTLNDFYFNCLYKPLIKLKEADADKWTVGSEHSAFTDKYRCRHSADDSSAYANFANIKDTERSSKNLHAVYCDESGKAITPIRSGNLISVGVPEPLREDFSVSERFHSETEHRYIIKKIFKINSDAMRKRYTTYEKSLKCDTKVKTRELWHGCPATSRFKIANNGFEVNRAGQNGFCYYGYGIYFSTSAKRPSALYSTADEHTQKKYLFLCEVATGNFTIGREEYKQPPINKQGNLLRNVPNLGGARPKSSKEVAYYHSCVDDVEQPAIFVVFNDAASCPKYMIEFADKI